ncbi:MAG: hypothetical protein DCF25_13375 [Leptolyngbya foveolarum]|uniref:Uncharacterized protein n=1 Tax=Leptolyngbya foveolarum TaxID=47253 RepID=A0A2W4U9A6_9CYAN|nr:MAG: hypothetical protein DCF25_13375 [Leptolyngbya foveolarum]
MPLKATYQTLNKGLEKRRYTAEKQHSAYSSTSCISWPGVNKGFLAIVREPLLLSENLQAMYQKPSFLRQFKRSNGSTVKEKIIFLSGKYVLLSPSTLSDDADTPR